MKNLIDQIGRSISLEKTPKRIISLVPSQTELLSDLGLKDMIVGVTKFCVHPYDMKSKAGIVGGTKQVHINRIQALQPDIILCNKEENTKDIVEACESICPVHVSDIFNMSDSLALIQQYGKIFDVEVTASRLVDKITLERESFDRFVKTKPKLNVVYFIWRRPWMVAANSTFINHLMQLNNFENQYQADERYPEIQLEVNEAIDLVLLSSEPYPFKEAHKKELSKFYPNAKLELIDGEMFSWYGSRLTKAFKYFKQLRSSLC